jgi:hypothetical protein
MRHPALVPDDRGRGGIGWRVVPAEGVSAEGVSGIGPGHSSGILYANDIEENPSLRKYRIGNPIDNRIAAVRSIGYSCCAAT